jgi:glutamate-ammonia-ligase adenylyltransferase
MACSLASAERYYETWGRLWERAALLRARPIAGHRELGWRLEREVLSPFTWRREVDPSLATALAELVLRARAELSEDPARDLKLGPGGIREAEFFVQSLQLVWGGVEPTLRVPGTIAALARLRSRGLVSDLEARTIADAWRLLRRVEHRVQWMTGAQTHLLPDDPDELERLARGLGHRDWSELRVEIERARARVSELFASLAPERPRPPPRWEALLARLAEGVAPQEAAPALGPETLEHLAALGRRPDGLLGALTRERRPELADRVLDAVADSPDPEQAAAALRTFFARLSSPAPYVAALADEPRALSRFVTALGGSAFVAEAIVSSPDLADVTLFGPSQLGPDTARALIDAEIAVATLALERRAEASEASDRHQALVGALRRAKRRMMVEVAVADLADQIDTREATRLLSGLADEILERAVRLELGDARGLGVIAVGKLGGRDIGYGSDLDVLFLFDRAAAPPGAHAPEYFTRAAQRVIRAISALHPDGPGYELDTRLRPSGSHGLLVTSIGAFARYHGVTRDGASERPPPSGPSVLASGAAWERQSLLRARACAGDPALGAEAIRIAHVAAYERGAPPAGEVHHMRRRIEIEIARERAGRWDLKLGRGGLLDVEFAVQWLQMRHGMDRRVRTTDIAQALEALATLGYVARNHYEALREGYAFLRRLEQRVHVVHGSGATRLDEAAPGLEPLARRMGVSSSARRGAVAILLDRYRDVTASIRAAYLGILGVADEG